MKYRVTMKSPDALHNAMNNNVRPSLPDSMDDDQKDVVTNQAAKAAERWFRFGEYLTVEIDTDAMTCVVVPRGG